MKNESGLSDRLLDIVVYTLAMALILLTVYPLLYVTFASVSDAGQLIRHSGLLYKPLGFSLEAYKNVFQNPGILKGYANTGFIVFFGVLVNLLLTAMGAYVLSRRNVLWNKMIMFIILFTMFFSGGMIGVFIAKVVGSFRGCEPPTGLPACDWHVYAGVGMLIGVLTLPALALNRLRQRASATSERD